MLPWQGCSAKETPSNLGRHLWIHSFCLQVKPVSVSWWFLPTFGSLYTARNTCSYSVLWQHFNDKANKTIRVWFRLYPSGSSSVHKYTCPTGKDCPWERLTWLEERDSIWLPIPSDLKAAILNSRCPDYRDFAWLTSGMEILSLY